MKTLEVSAPTPIARLRSERPAMLVGGAALLSLLALLAILAPVLAAHSPSVVSG